MSIGRNTAVGLVTNGAVLGLGVVLSIVLTRSLGPEQRGIYVLLVATNVLLTHLIDLSMEVACSTFLARGRYRLAEINTVATIAAVVLGLAGVVIVSVAFLFLRDSVFRNIPYEYLLAALLLTPLTIYQTYWNAMMTGLNRVIMMNKVNLALNISNTVLLIVAVAVLRLGIPGFLAAWGLNTLIGAVVGFVMAARIERPGWPPKRAALRDLLHYGLRLHGLGIAHQLFLRFDMFAVNALAGTTQVGFYSLSTSLAEKLWMPLNVVKSSSTAKIAQLLPDESALLTAKVTRSTLMLLFAMAIPFAAVSPWLIPFLYGPEFSASVLPLLILFVGTVGFAVMLIVDTYILGQMERPGLLSIIAWLELAVSIPLYVVLIYSFGIVGAALASALTYLLAMASTLYVFRRNTGLSPLRVLVPRREDFQDYKRLLRAGMARVPVLRRYARSTP
ncbi:MAG: oligosaccharide flippase family protein [Chloroflexia bacterium]